MNRPGMIAGLVLVLAGCAAQQPSASSEQPLSDAPVHSAPLASADPYPSESPGVQTPSPVTPAITVDSIAEVITNDLVVRSEPGLQAASRIDPIRLDEGILLWVIEGPVDADGFTWYRGIPFEDTASDVRRELPEPGWVATGRDAEEWIGPWSGSCPTEEISSMTRAAAVLVECFGDREIELAGNLRSCFRVTGNNVTPGWFFGGGCQLTPLGLPPGCELACGIDLSFRDFPDIEPTEELIPVVVRGHFDDPEASTCRVHADLASPYDDPPELLILRCRGQFAVTQLTLTTR